MSNASSLELIVSRPAGARVVGAYLEGDAEAGAFYGRHFTRLDDFRSKAEEVSSRFGADERRAAVEALTPPPGGEERLERFVEEGGYVVTTGQQPGLFGGPLYGVLKALTAVRLAEALEERLGRPVLPVFWVASEDHDWEEANHADVVGVDNELHRFEVEAPDPERRPALHRIPLDAAVQDVVDAFVGALPETEFHERCVALVRNAFAPGETLPGGYSAVMAGLLARFGLFLTDAASPAVKRRSAPVLRAELERAEELEGILRDTASRLEGAGFDVQVPVLDGGVNVFMEGPGGRERLYRDGADFVLRTTGGRVTLTDAVAAQEADPLTLSPNVLLRPVVESVVFPTLAYVGGPGEVAYFAQLGAYFEAHGVEMPIVFPRFAVTPVESKIRKVLDKFGVDVADLDRPLHDLAGDMAREGVPDDVRGILGRLRGAIGASAGELQTATRSVDPTLKGPVQHMRSQAFAAVDELEKKIVHAVKRETDIAVAQLEKAQVHLYPRGRPAERVQSPFYYVSRFGEGFLDRLHEAFRVNFE